MVKDDPFNSYEVNIESTNDNFQEPANNEVHEINSPGHFVNVLSFENLIENKKSHTQQADQTKMFGINWEKFYQRKRF